MHNPIINILVRTSARPQLFHRMLKSIAMQDYRHINVFVAYDEYEFVSYVPDFCEVVLCRPDRKEKFFYNRYCNDLKARVKDGWFFFLDDDDYLLHKHVISNVVRHLINPDRAYIVQFLRDGKAKPRWLRNEDARIQSGRIGMPCLWLHNSHKDLADLDGVNEDGDYRWIKKVTDKLKPKFLQEIVVCADRRSRGLPEDMTSENYGLVKAFCFETKIKKDGDY